MPDPEIVSEVLVLQVGALPPLRTSPNRSEGDLLGIERSDLRGVLDRQTPAPSRS